MLTTVVARSTTNVNYTNNEKLEWNYHYVDAFRVKLFCV